LFGKADEIDNRAVGLEPWPCHRGRLAGSLIADREGNGEQILTTTHAEALSRAADAVATAKG